MSISVRSLIQYRKTLSIDGSVECDVMILLCVGRPLIGIPFSVNYEPLVIKNVASSNNVVYYEFRFLRWVT